MKVLMHLSIFLVAEINVPIIGNANMASVFAKKEGPDLIVMIFYVLVIAVLILNKDSVIRLFLLLFFMNLA